MSNDNEGAGLGVLALLILGGGVLLSALNKSVNDRSFKKGKNGEAPIPTALYDNDSAKSIRAAYRAGQRERLKK